jgi:hypothetical protein
MKFDAFKVNGMTPADRENTLPKAALTSVLEQFPEAALRIQKLFLQSPSFQSLCEDYYDSLAAWQYWRQAASEDAPALCQSYAELLEELGQEVRQYLEQEQAPGSKPWNG